MRQDNFAGKGGTKVSTKVGGRLLKLGGKIPLRAQKKGRGGIPEKGKKRKTPT